MRESYDELQEQFSAVIDERNKFETTVERLAEEVERLTKDLDELKEVEDTASAAFKTVSDQIQEIEHYKAAAISDRAHWRAGLERAAVIAETWHYNLIDEDVKVEIAAAIRSEIKT